MQSQSSSQNSSMPRLMRSLTDRNAKHVEQKSQEWEFDFAQGKPLTHTEPRESTKNPEKSSQSMARSEAEQTEALLSSARETKNTHRQLPVPAEHSWHGSEHGSWCVPPPPAFFRCASSGSQPVEHFWPQMPCSMPSQPPMYGNMIISHPHHRQAPSCHGPSPFGPSPAFAGCGGCFGAYPTVFGYQMPTSYTTNQVKARMPSFKKHLSVKQRRSDKCALKKRVAAERLHGKNSPTCQRIASQPDQDSSYLDKLRVSAMVTPEEQQEAGCAKAKADTTKGASYGSSLKSSDGLVIGKKRSAETVFNQKKQTQISSYLVRRAALVILTPPKRVNQGSRTVESSLAKASASKEERSWQGKKSALQEPTCHHESTTCKGSSSSPDRNNSRLQSTQTVKEEQVVSKSGINEVESLLDALFPVATV